MAKVVVKSKAKKAKRKFPVDIVAPEFLGYVKLGSSQVTDLSSLVGKTAKLNLMYVTGIAKNQNIRLRFKIVDVASGLAKTTVSYYEQIPYYLSRFVKEGSDLVEDSFTVKSKDGVSLLVKPFIVTKMRTSYLISSKIREKVREIFMKEASGSVYDDLIASVISGKIQVLLRSEVKKIFPVKAFELRKVEMI